ncbi:MAG: hypothetical protein VKI42_07815 [Synechococcaceae cyanobacterium]|nr:hypothetical protein [Synechococcaceae cyanobacterium]
MTAPPPPPPPPPSQETSEDQVDIQRQRILSTGPKITASDLIGTLASGTRLILFLILLGIALVVTLFFPPLGILLLFMLGLVLLTAR